MKSVVVSPARNSGVRSTATRKSRFVVTPPRCRRSSASASRPAASRRVGACAITFASIGSNSVPIREPGRDARVPAHRGLGRGLERGERAGRGQEVVRGVLGVEPHLDRRARERDVRLRVAERLARGDAQLLAHEIDPRHRLGHRVLDLEARVHLEEEELAALVVDAGTRPCPPTA